LCDLHKAFDCVNHKILLGKWELCGITVKFLNLLKSYVEARYQRSQNTPTYTLITYLNIKK